MPLLPTDFIYDTVVLEVMGCTQSYFRGHPLAAFLAFATNSSESGLEGTACPNLERCRCCRRAYRGAASLEVTASNGWSAHTSFTDSH
jgi:hypothetical protein